jgi:hypothetical protein
MTWRRKNEVMVTLRRLFCVSNINVMACKWTHVGSRGRSKAWIDGHNNFLGDITCDYNLFITA